MFTFCDVSHETKRENANKLSRVRSTDWESSLTTRSIQDQSPCDDNNSLSIIKHLLWRAFTRLLVSQTNPVGFELLSYVNTFFTKFAGLLVT